MKNRITWLILPILAITLATPTSGQSIEETLQDLIDNNAKGYLGPFATAFGTGMNSGTYRTAKPHKILGMDVHINLTMTTVPDAGLTYDFYIPDEITLPLVLGGRTYDIPLNGTLLYPGDRTSSTFFGEDVSHTISPSTSYAIGAIGDKLIADYGFSSTEVNAAQSVIASEINNKMTIYTPKGINVSTLPVLMPQFSIGLPFDTELTLRGFTVKLGDSDEELIFKGFGFKIGVNQFIPTVPLVFPAISVGYYSTSMDLAGFITAKNSILTLQASKSIPVLTFYGGFGIESSSIDVNVDDENGVDLFDFSLDGDNGFRTTIGIRIKLMLLSINMDYNIGKYSAFNAGLGLTFR